MSHDDVEKGVRAGLRAATMAGEKQGSAFCAYAIRALNPQAIAASVPVEKPEPVAWRSRYKNSGWVLDHQPLLQNVTDQPGFEEQPLYTAPPADERDAEIKWRCSGCGNEIDPDCCGCGDSKKSHTGWEGHPFVPAGCDCLRESMHDENNRLRADREAHVAAMAQLNAQLRESGAVIAGLRAELEQALKDAARYMWLRGGSDISPVSVRWPKWEVREWRAGYWNTLFAEDMDAAIDAAIEQEKP